MDKCITTLVQDDITYLINIGLNQQTIKCSSQRKVIISWTQHSTSSAIFHISLTSYNRATAVLLLTHITDSYTYDCGASLSSFSSSLTTLLASSLSVYSVILSIIIFSSSISVQADILLKLLT